MLELLFRLMLTFYCQMKIYKNIDRELILRRLIHGETMSRVSKEVGVSRTTLYKWLKMRSSGVRNSSRMGGKRRISAVKRRRMVKLALKYPEYSIREISVMSGLSLGFTWSCLKRYSLNTRKQRYRRFLNQGTYLYKRVGGVERTEMIERYYAGEAVVKLCREFGISRTIFYRWVQKYLKETDKSRLFLKRRSKRRGRFRLTKDIDDIICDIVAGDPDLSISELHNRLRLRRMRIGYSRLYDKCRRFGLNTYRRRLVYANSCGIASGWDKVALSTRKPVKEVFSQFTQISACSFVLSLWLLIFGWNFLVDYSGSVVDDNREMEPKMPVVSIDKNKENREIIYIVQRGDNLWHISEDIFNSGYNWVDIAAVNRLPDPNYIEIGQRLVIPVVDAKLATLGLGR